MSEGGPGKLRWRDLRPKRERRQWRPGLELSRALMNSNHTSTSSMTRRTRISEDLRRIIRSSWSISLLDLNRVRIARSPSPRNRQLFQLQKCLQARHQSQPGLSRLTGNQACHRLRNHPQCPHHRNSSTSLSQRQLRLPPQSRKRRPLLRSLKEVASPTCLRGSRSKTTRTRLQKKLPSDTTVQVPKTDAPAPDQAATTSDIVAEAPPAAEVPQTAEAPSAVEEAVKPVNKVPKKPTTGTEALGEVKKPVKKVTKKQPVRPQAPEDTASKDVVAGVTPVGVTTSSEAPVAAAPKKKTKKKLPASAAPESTEPAAAVVAMEEPKAKMTGVVGEASGAVAAPKKAVKKVVKKKPAAPEPEPMAA
mmetsp:Transcript_9565/g.28907  ORF Transcript_9565/g.28907 Transcript_9565/m.28907 type:complete len:362 (+) Transcript_9565:1034-2119(+)